MPGDGIEKGIEHGAFGRSDANGVFRIENDVVVQCHRSLPAMAEIGRKTLENDPPIFDIEPPVECLR
ncbi:hypothetical protein D3C83_178920 [compost metagenome]